MKRYIDKLRSSFSAAPRVFTVLALVAVITVPNMMSALSESQDQSIYTIGAPCAVFDTRAWDKDGDGLRGEEDPEDDGKPQPGDELSFLIADNTDQTDNRPHTFYDQPETTETVEAHQGAIKNRNNVATANPDGCGVHENAETVFLNLVSVSPEGAGNLQAYPFGTLNEDKGGVLLFDGNDTVGIQNGLLLEINTSAEAEAAGAHLQVTVTSASTHVRGLITGYTCPSAGCGT